MNISPSTQYKQQELNRQVLRRHSDAALLKSVEQVLSEWPVYGYRRVTAELRRRGTVVAHKRVARIMRENTQKANPKRPKRKTHFEAFGALRLNLAKGFVPDGPDQLRVGNIA